MQFVVDAGKEFKMSYPSYTICVRLKMAQQMPKMWLDINVT